MSDWLQWTLTVVVGILLAVVGWAGNKIAELDKEVAVLKAKPHVDPIQYTQAVSEVASAVAALTQQIATNDQYRTQQIEELKRQIEELKVLVERLQNQKGNVR